MVVREGKKETGLRELLRNKEKVEGERLRWRRRRECNPSKRKEEDAHLVGARESRKML